MIGAVLASLMAIGLLFAHVGSTTGAYFSDVEQGSDNVLRCGVYTYFYLHNNPTPPIGVTDSQAVLPTSTTVPTATTLWNYDEDRDSSAGLVVARGGEGPGDTDPATHQTWRSGSLPDGLSLVGTVTIDLWTAMRDFGQEKAGEVIVYLRDYNGSNHTEIGNGTAYEIDWQGGSTTWVQKTITVSGLDHTIPAGNELEVELTVGDNGADDMWFAYDTTSHPSVVQIPD